MFCVADKIVCITGSSRGLGKSNDDLTPFFYKGRV